MFCLLCNARGTAYAETASRTFGSAPSPPSNAKKVEGRVLSRRKSQVAFLLKKGAAKPPFKNWKTCSWFLLFFGLPGMLFNRLLFSRNGANRGGFGGGKESQLCKYLLGQVSVQGKHLAACNGNCRRTLHFSGTIITCFLSGLHQPFSIGRVL